MNCKMCGGLIPDWENTIPSIRKCQISGYCSFHYGIAVRKGLIDDKAIKEQIKQERKGN